MVDVDDDLDDEERASDSDEENEDGETTVSFVRPVRHLTALYGTEVVPVKLFGLDAGRTTSGHRFHTTEPVEIASADVYEETMQKAFVDPSFDDRRERIRSALFEHAEKLDAVPIVPEDLLDEVTALTEWPVVYESQFDEAFLVRAAGMSHSDDAAQFRSISRFAIERASS